MPFKAISDCVFYLAFAAFKSALVCNFVARSNDRSIDVALTKKLKWANHGLFFIYFRLFKHTIQYLQKINMKKSNQYTVPGFELTTFRT